MDSSSKPGSSAENVLLAPPAPGPHGGASGTSIAVSAPSSESVGPYIEQLHYRPRENNFNFSGMICFIYLKYLYSSLYRKS